MQKKIIFLASLWLYYSFICVMTYDSFCLITNSQTLLCFTSHEKCSLMFLSFLLSGLEKCHHFYLLIADVQSENFLVIHSATWAISASATHDLPFEVYCRIAWMESLSGWDLIRSLLLWLDITGNFFACFQPYIMRHCTNLGRKCISWSSI